jgi:hypothetical protein
VAFFVDDFFNPCLLIRHTSGTLESDFRWAMICFAANLLLLTIRLLFFISTSNAQKSLQGESQQAIYPRAK